MQAVGFEARETLTVRPGTDRPGVITSAFDSAQAAPGMARGRGGVVNSGFGAAPTGPQPTAARQGVKAAGFANASPAPAPVNVVRKTAEDRVTPAEVLFKPTPDYSAEARAQRIEGTVTLEVEFSASGQVRVLRVIRSLGYGLDEMAVRAAEQIRFKPALAGGKPVDSTANVQIIFHLT
jgi:TonB family protein